jgi:hypothetical protein
MGYRLSLTRMEDHWRARFGRDAMTSADGYGVALTPWAAVQSAAWMAVRRASPARDA